MTNKPLRQITVDNPSLDYVKPGKEKEFVRKHSVLKTKVPAYTNNGEDDDKVFKATNMKVSPRPGKSDPADSTPKDSYGKGNDFDDVSNNKNRVVPESYSIIRMYHDGNAELVVEGVSLEEAQAHCSDESTETNDWFDGYVLSEKLDPEVGELGYLFHNPPKTKRSKATKAMPRLKRVMARINVKKQKEKERADDLGSMWGEENVDENKITDKLRGAGKRTKTTAKNTMKWLSGGPVRGHSPAYRNYLMGLDNKRRHEETEINEMPIKDFPGDDKVTQRKKRLNRFLDRKRHIPFWDKKADCKVCNKETTKEEEQLDELEKGTVSKYFNKAVNQNASKVRARLNIARKGGTPGKPDHKELERDKGIDNAVKRLKKEEFEQLDEKNKKTKEANKALLKNKKKKDKAYKRPLFQTNMDESAAEHLAMAVPVAALAGAAAHTVHHMAHQWGHNLVDKLVSKRAQKKPMPSKNKLTAAKDAMKCRGKECRQEKPRPIRKEEEETEINEISKKLLGRYVKKASDSARQLSYGAGLGVGGASKTGPHKTNIDTALKRFQKSEKRQTGINRAVARLVLRDK